MKKFLSISILSIFILGCQSKSGVFLMSDNVQTRFLTQDDSYCGGSTGNSSQTGDYRLESFLEGKLVSTLDLGELTLVGGTPQDDIHLLPVQLHGQDLYKLVQYESCNSRSVRLFMVNETGDINLVSFVKDDSELESISTDYEGTVKIEEQILSFCPYDNISGQVICDAYEFVDGQLNYRTTSYYPLEDYIKGY